MTQIKQCEYHQAFIKKRKKKKKKTQLVEFSCSCVLNPPPFLCFPEHYLIISFQNLESYHGNSLPTFSFEKDPSSPQRNHQQVAVQLPLLRSASVFTHHLQSDLGQEPCQWPMKWNSIQSGWLRLGWCLLPSMPLHSSPPPALAGGGLSPGGGGTAKFLFKNTWILF